MKLSEHFTLDEFTFSETAVRKGLDNTPQNDAIMSNLRLLASNMEKVRALLNNPIKVNSAFRSPAVNVAIGGSMKSHHCLGYAIDFVCPKFGTPREICSAIMKSDIQYDQLIYEGTWVHLSFAPSMRRENLQAHFKNGKATYSALT